MNHGLLKAKLAISALALVVAGTSYATSNVQVGGGATLPALAYAGTGAGIGAVGTQTFPGSTGSLFAVYTSALRAPQVSYCATGSGAGKNILDGVSGTSVQNPCSTSVNGFGAANALVNRTDLKWPNYAASDSPLSQTDFTNYTTNHTATGALPVQFPSISGDIAIALNKTTDKGVVLNNTNTNFNDLQICLIYSGTVTTWGDSRLASAFTLGSGDTLSGAISVAYRGDNSGTSFNFSNHLANAGQATGANECSSITTTTKHFVVTQTFSSAVAEYLPTLPGTWIAGTGNAGVANAVLNNAGSIGYVEAAYATQLGVKYAKVGGFDPFTDFGGTKVSIPAASIIFNKVISGNNANTGLANLVAISPAPTTSCIAVADPASYALPTSGYPIVAVTYLLGNAVGNGTTDLANTRNLLGAPYNATVTGSSSLTSIGSGKGYAFLNVNGALTTSSISACLQN